MKRFICFLLLIYATIASAAGPQPCYFSGQYFRCFPPSGYAGVDGTVSLPAVSFVSDPDTGMYWIGANDLGFATGGVKGLEVTAGGIKTNSITWLDTTKGVLGTTTNDNAAAGYVGEYFSSTRTTNISGSATLGTFTDSGLTFTLTAGDWDVGATVTEDMAATGATTTGVTGIVEIFDSTNTASIASARGGFANTASALDFSNISVITRLSIAGTTAYKLRFAVVAASGSPTAAACDIVATSAAPAIFWARRRR